MKKESVMHSIVFLTLAALIAVISMPQIASAGDSASMTVSCTIPQIPSLNALTIEGETLKADMSKASAQENDINIQKEAKEREVQPPIMVVVQSPALMVKTLYLR